jgi:hypothetical protein
MPLSEGHTTTDVDLRLPQHWFRSLRWRLWCVATTCCLALRRFHLLRMSIVLVADQLVGVQSIRLHGSDSNSTAVCKSVCLNPQQATNPQPSPWPSACPVRDSACAAAAVPLVNMVAPPAGRHTAAAQVGCPAIPRHSTFPERKLSGKNVFQQVILRQDLRPLNSVRFHKREEGQKASHRAVICNMLWLAQGHRCAPGAGEARYCRYDMQCRVLW